MATKHGREVRHGVFQIGKGGVKNSCLALALLVGKSYLENDTNAKKLERNRNLTLTELYTDDNITNVYTTSGISVGPVRVDQLRLVYENYLKPDGVDLVVFSKAKSDTIVYDSRLDANQYLHRITNNVIFLWLNDAHYDLVLSPYTFSRCNSGKFCFQCMRYFRRAETKTSHVCRTSLTCLRCYSSPTKCPKESDFEQQCTECDVVFYNRTCFFNHLTQRSFKTSNARMETACQRFFFCATCYKIVTRKTMVNSVKSTKHKCDEMFCLHCDKMKKMGHYCFIKPVKPQQNTVHPTLYFYDFETRVDEDGYMIPFYCVIQKVCTLCDEKPFVKTYEHFLPHPSEPRCDISVEPVPCCDYRQYVFENNNKDIVKDLMDFMMAQPKGSVWVVHNG